MNGELGRVDCGMCGGIDLCVFPVDDIGREVLRVPRRIGQTGAVIIAETSQIKAGIGQDVAAIDAGDPAEADAAVKGELQFDSLAGASDRFHLQRHPAGGIGHVDDFSRQPFRIFGDRRNGDPVLTMIHCRIRPRYPSGPSLFRPTPFRVSRFPPINLQPAFPVFPLRMYPKRPAKANPPSTVRSTLPSLEANSSLRGP